MFVGLLIILIVGVVLVTARSGGAGPHQGLGTAIRRFFQYALQYGLVCIVAIGLEGLIARPLRRDVLALGDQTDLARGLSFTIVGVPVLWLIVRWTRRRIAADARETQSVAWAFYLALAELTALAVMTSAIQDVLAWVTRSGAFDAGAVGRSIAWGVVWIVHVRVTRTTTPAGTVRDHQLAGAAFGLWSAAISVGTLVASVLHSFITLSGKELIADASHPVMRSAIGVLVGAAVWFVYWVRIAQRSPRTLHWHAYVLLLGVGSGLIVALVSMSVVLYDVLVWTVGSPATTDAATHFRSSMDAAGLALAGTTIWWYHRTVLREVGDAARDEARRVYEYLMALIALAAAAVGVTILLVAGLEALTQSALIAGSGAGNTLLLAVTLLIVGAPIWLLFWRVIERAVAADPAPETSSLTRRVYLSLLFGVVGVAAVVALLIAVYLLFSDLVAGRFGVPTIRSMRWGLGILISSAAIAWFHWRIYREERDAAQPHGRRRVLVIGPVSEGQRDTLADRLHARVEVLQRTDVPGLEAPSDAAVEAAVAAESARDVVVLIDHAGVHVIPVERD